VVASENVNDRLTVTIAKAPISTNILDLVVEFFISMSFRILELLWFYLFVWKVYLAFRICGTSSSWAIVGFGLYIFVGAGSKGYSKHRYHREDEEQFFHWSLGF